MPQDQVFPTEPVSPAVLIQTDGGPETVLANFYQYPIAIHDAWDYPADAQQAVTHIPSGLAFRTQMTEDGAAALADELLAGIPDQWLLDWTTIGAATAGELALLQALVIEHPNDYVATINVATDPDVEVWICNTGAGLSYGPAMADADGNVTVTVEVPGTYDVYCYDPVSTDWGTDPSGPYSVDLDDEIDAAVTADTVGAEGIPCKP